MTSLKAPKWRGVKSSQPKHVHVLHSNIAQEQLCTTVTRKGT